MREQEFHGCRALITGGASGIGWATARLLHRLGAQVAVLDRDVSPVTDVVDATAGLEAVTADVTDDQAVRAAVDRVVELLGGLSVLVNNAGIGAAGGIEANSDAEWHRVFDVNVVGIARVTRAALPALRRSGRSGPVGAAIVNTCSIAATVGLQERAVYSATKGAVLSLTLAMAADLLPDGIRVNAVNPGTAATPWISRLLDAAIDPGAERSALAARQPHGRLVDAEEVAHAIAYLASPSAGSTTGTTLAVDGGMERLRRRPV